MAGYAASQAKQLEIWAVLKVAVFAYAFVITTLVVP